ncbi:MAG: hypothetical protein WCQ47_06465 [bacterium]
MKKALTLLLLFILSSSVLIYAQDITPPLQDPMVDKDIEWVVLHMHNTESPYEGVKKAYGTTVDQKDVNLPPVSDDDLFGIKFERYLESNREDLNKKGITFLRFVMDKANNLSAKQKKMISDIAAKHSFKIRFETIKVDWEARKKRLQNSAEQIIDESVPSDIRETTDIRPEIEETKSGFRKFWNDIYEQPTRTEVAGGVTKGVITLTLTLGAWASMGMGPGVMVFWVLTAEHIAQEIFFGPYIKTYVNFLYKKIKAKTGDLGVAVWGNIQGFTLFSFDKLLIYLANFGTPPWDPKYLAGYWGMATVGSMLGSFMPIGIFKLIQKGWIGRGTGMVSMQALDLIMPVEGALLAFDSPYLIWVFSIHQAFKFGVYLTAVAANQRGTIIVMPEDLYNTPEAKEYLNISSVPRSDLFKSSERTKVFLEDENIPMALKVNFAKYIRKIFDKEQDLIKTRPEFKKILTEILETTITYLDKTNMELSIEIKKNEGKSDFKNLFLKETGDLESGYSYTGWDTFWKNANERKIASKQQSALNNKLTMANKMFDQILNINFDEYEINLSSNSKSIIKNFIIKGSILSSLGKEKTYAGVTVDEAFNLWFESLPSEPGKIKNQSSFVNLLINNELLKWVYGDGSNTKKLSQGRYLSYMLESLPESAMSSSQRQYLYSIESPFDKASQTTKEINTDLEMRVNDFLLKNRIDNNTTSLDENAKKAVEFMIIEDELRPEDLELLFQNGSDNKSLITYLSAKSVAGDKLAEYKLQLIDLILDMNLIKVSYGTRYYENFTKFEQDISRLEYRATFDKLIEERERLLKDKFEGFRK